MICDLYLHVILLPGIMVKGKQQTKLVQAKKSNSVPQTRHETAGGTSPSTSSSSSRKAKASSPSVLCCGCSKPVTEDVKALQCDRCLGEEWKCVQCLGLSVEVYDQLVADPRCSLRWFCDGCEKMVMNASSKVENQYGDNDSDKIDKLVSLVEKLVQKLSDVDEKLNSKCDVKAVQQIEQRVKNIEERVCKGETDLERRLASIDEHVSGFINDKIKSLGESRTTDSSALCVEQVVKEELGKKLDEDKDIEARRNNIIVYRIPENPLDSLSERKDKDTEFVTDLLDQVFMIKVQDGDIVSMFRLGRFTEDADVPRPVLVKFRNYDTKDSVMTNLRQLKQADRPFNGISIAHDLTPKQREEIKSLIASAKKDHMDQHSENVENFRFIVVGQGSRKRVLKLRKQN